jgi:hypothetical protein
MVSLRLEAISRFIGGLLLINIGIFVSLLVVTSAGGAIPSSSYSTDPNFMKGSPPELIRSLRDSNLQNPLQMVYLSSYASLPQIAVLYNTLWNKEPIKVWSLIAAASLIFICILYLSIRRVHSNMSKEIFP